MPNAGGAVARLDAPPAFGISAPSGKPGTGGCKREQYWDFLGIGDPGVWNFTPWRNLNEASPSFDASLLVIRTAAIPFEHGFQKSVGGRQGWVSYV